MVRGQGGEGDLPPWVGGSRPGWHSEQRAEMSLPALPQEGFLHSFPAWGDPAPHPCVGTPEDSPKVLAQGHAGGAQLRWSGVASVPKCPQGQAARAAGLPFQRRVTACVGLVPSPLGLLTHALISVGFWSLFSGGQGADDTEEPLQDVPARDGLGPNHSALTK